MTKMRIWTFFSVLAALAILGLPARSQGQAAVLMEEPYGFFGTLNPTGHTAIYFARLCTESPVKLRHCRAGELGSVIARYQGINGYDWLAVPLIPYLYSVDDASQVPARVNRATVASLRLGYHRAHLTGIGKDEGTILHGGWSQLIGVSYERRIYAFRFATTLEEDDVVMEELNDRENLSHFDLIYNNCADFARRVLNVYFPHTFPRTFFPDAGMTTPRQIASKLVRYSAKHPETDLSVFEIPQVPGYRRHSGTNKSVSASLITTGYAIPIAVLNPYLAGALLVDYIARGRYPVLPEHPEVLDPAELSELTGGQDPGASIPGPQPGVTSVGSMRQPVALNPEGSTLMPVLRDPGDSHQ